MIRKYLPKDKEQAKKLYSDLMYQEPTLSKLDNPHYEKFCYFNNELLGMIMLESSYLTLSIFNIHISESARGKGVGSKLVDIALELAKKYSLHGVRVNCDSSNKLAQDFYRKNGFKWVGKVNCYDVENHTAEFFYKPVKK